MSDIKNIGIGTGVAAGGVGITAGGFKLLLASGDHASQTGPALAKSSTAWLTGGLSATKDLGTAVTRMMTGREAKTAAEGARLAQSHSHIGPALGKFGGGMVAVVAGAGIAAAGAGIAISGALKN